VRERCFDRIRYLGANKHCFALSASAPALSDHEDVERQLLAALEEGSDVDDDEYGHLLSDWPAAHKEGVEGDISEKGNYTAALAVAAAELAVLPTTKSPTPAKKAQGRPRKVCA